MKLLMLVSGNWEKGEGELFRCLTLTVGLNAQSPDRKRKQQHSTKDKSSPLMLFQKIPNNHQT